MAVRFFECPSCGRQARWAAGDTVNCGWCMAVLTRDEATNTWVITIPAAPERLAELQDFTRPEFEVAARTPQQPHDDAVAAEQRATRYQEALAEQAEALGRQLGVTPPAPEVLPGYTPAVQIKVWQVAKALNVPVGEVIGLAQELDLLKPSESGKGLHLQDLTQEKADQLLTTFMERQAAVAAAALTPEGAVEAEAHAVQSG